MPTVFCSTKLADFLGLKSREPSLSLDNWNAQLCFLFGKKSVVFVHKETFYSFVLVDVKKKDFTDFKKLFFEGFTNQLKKDNLYLPAIEKKLANMYQETFVLSTTDGDKSTIGYINDCISRLRYFQMLPNHTIEDLYSYINEHYNSNYVTVKKYQKPIDLIKKSLYL